MRVKESPELSTDLSRWYAEGQLVDGLHAAVQMAVDLGELTDLQQI